MTSFAPLESIRFCILFALAKEPMRGAAIENQIAIDSRSTAFVQTATIYKTLKSLEKSGLIEPAGRISGNDPKYYQLTVSGKKILKREIQRLKDTLAIAHDRI